MKILFYVILVHWFENNICRKKNRLFSPKIGEKKCQNPFQAIRLKKKWHGPLSH